MNNHQYPDIVKLIEWAQNTKPNPIDVRLVLLHRDYRQQYQSAYYIITVNNEYY